MADIRPPPHREAFEIAIFCALKVEYDAVTLLFDKYWDTDYGRVKGDMNTYTAGMIGSHNVILVLLAGIGKVNSSIASANINPSFTGIKLALLVGICGGVPKDNSGNDVFLGDVIISDSVVQYDFAQRLPDGDIPRGEVRDILAMASPNIRMFVKTIDTQLHLENLRERTLQNLRFIQKVGDGQYDYPGQDLDRLFEPTFRHRHDPSMNCVACTNCVLKSDPTCERARVSTCAMLRCDETRLVKRGPRLLNRNSGNKAEDNRPRIHFGPIASGDLVMKSGEDRDKIARAYNVIAFEMEGAGIFATIPTIVIKGVCDYADSHKNKAFQNYAAATAASVMKGVLQQYQRTDTSLQRPTIANKAKGGVGRGGYADYGDVFAGRVMRARVTRDEARGGTGIGGHAKGYGVAIGGDAEGGDASGLNAYGGDAIGGDAEISY